MSKPEFRFRVPNPPSRAVRVPKEKLVAAIRKHIAVSTQQIEETSQAYQTHMYKTATYYPPGT